MVAFRSFGGGVTGRRTSAAPLEESLGAACAGPVKGLIKSPKARSMTIRTRFNLFSFLDYQPFLASR
jgi:hypothetical protein